MEFKFCPECGRKLNEDFKFCPECGLALPEGEDDLAKRIDDLRKKEAEAAFRKSVLEVAEAFFAMSKDEREAMKQYARDRCKEAEEEAKALKQKHD